MPEKIFRERFYTMTKKREAFTVNSMCIDFCKICTFLKVVFLMFMCTIQCLAHIDIYKSMYLLRYGVLSVYFIKKYKKKLQASQ